MKLRNKITTGILMSASVLALAGCSQGTIDDAVAEFDSIDSGTVELDYEINSRTYGEYGITLTGLFERVEGAEEDNAQSNAGKSLMQTVSASELEDEPSDESEVDEAEIDEDDVFDIDISEIDEALLDVDLSQLSEEEIEELSQEMTTISVDEDDDIIGEEDPSRGYNYQIEEVNRMFADGQETTSTGEIIALGDTMYDKVFLTGSEANGRFVYDSRDVGITEYPIHDFVTISPIIDAFDLDNSDIEVATGDLANGDSGHVFTVTPEQVVTSLQEEATNTLAQNILGIVTEVDVDSVIIGINGTTFTVEAISTGGTGENTTPTSEAGTDSEDDSNGEDTVIGSLVLTKTAGDVEITEPSNAMDLDEFTSLVELFYQQQAEQQMDEQLTDEDVFGEEADLTDEDLEELESDLEELESELEELEQEDGELEEVEGEEVEDEEVEDED